MVSSEVPLVLASASSARLSTLTQAGVTSYVLVSDVDEDLVLTQAVSHFGELTPQDVALVLARAKCEAVAGRLSDDSCPEDAPIGALVPAATQCSSSTVSCTASQPTKHRR